MTTSLSASDFTSGEFQCVVLGDEPAALWALKRLAELNPTWLEKRELLWLRFSEDRPRPVAIPVRLVSRFGLTAGPSWAIELKLPGRTVSWDAESLLKVIPELPAPADLPAVGPRLHFPSPYVEAVREALRLRPELLGWAGGLWKYLGRARKLQAETVVLMALQCREMAWWDAAAELPEGVREGVASVRENPPESLSSRGGLTTITFRGLGSIASRRWILNLPFHRLRSLATTCPALRDLVTEKDLRAPLALSPLRLRVAAKAVPWTARPLTVLFDTDEIPEIDRETWPIVVREGAGPDGEDCEIEAFASTSRELSLDAALAAMRDAYGRVARLFPFVDDSLREVAVPLSMESCFVGEQRSAALAELESGLVERYDFTSIHTQTRKRGVFTLFPSLHCHLPYPLGTMFEARRLVEHIVGRKKLEASEKTAIHTVNR